MSVGAILALVRRHWQVALLVAACLFAFTWWRQYRGALIAKGRAEERVASWKAAATELAKLAAQRDTVTLRLVDTLTRWRLKRDSFPVPSIPDTVHDTVPVAVAAGAIRACQAEARACELVRASLEDRLELERRRRVLDSTALAAAVTANRRRSNPWPARFAIGILGFAVGRAVP